MLIDHGSGLGAAIAVQAAEIKSGDAMFAESALERWFRRLEVWLCNISHLHCMLFSRWRFGAMGAGL